MGGCLWSLLPFPILIALYRAVVKPITIMMGVADELLQPGGAIYEQLTALGYSMSNYTTSTNTFYEQIYQSKFISEHFDQFSGLSDRLVQMDYSFLGLDLSQTPDWHFWSFDFSNGTWVVLGLFMLPLISTALSYLSMYISRKINPQVGTSQQQQASASSMKTMMIVMPLMRLWIGYVMPAALCVYWIMNSLTGIIREVVLTRIYSKQMAKEDAERLERERAREEELERKRQETERLRAMNATKVNKNTSKKKQQAQAAQSAAERRAAAENRYENPETAEEATLAAAEASEGVDAIDPDVEDETVILGVPDESSVEDAPAAEDGEQQENVQ